MCCVCVHTHTQMQTMEYCSAIKKELNNAFRSNMDRPRDIILSEVSQTEKRQIYDIAYMGNLKKRYQ